jgi:hypothetical protein
MVLGRIFKGDCKKQKTLNNRSFFLFLMKAIILILILVLFTVGCEQAELQEEISTAEAQETLNANIELATDKELYHSNEMMNINVDISADKEEENITVKVYGIYASRNRLDLTKNTALSQGDNNIAFEYKTPSCNTCSGIKAGRYQITADILKDGSKIASVSKNIDIEQ